MLGIAFLVVFFIPRSVSGLNLKTVPLKDNYLSFSFTHPNMKEVGRLSFVSGTFCVELSRHLWEGFYIDAMLPLVTFSGDEVTGDTRFGELYLGIQKVFGNRDNLFSLSLGGLFKLKSQTMGTYLIQGWSNMYRILNYYGRGDTIYSNFGWFRSFGSDWFVKSEAGMAVNNIKEIPYPSGKKTQVFGHYAVAAGKDLNGILVTAEFSFVCDLTNFGKYRLDLYPFVTLECQLVKGTIQPAFFFIINLDDEIKNLVSTSIGVKLDISF